MRRVLASIFMVMCLAGFSLTAHALIDINTASISELQTLPRIGPGLAQAIIDYREMNGPFSFPEEIMNVPRIGSGTFDNIKDLITVGGDQQASRPARDSQSKTADKPIPENQPGYTATPLPTPTPEPTIEELMAAFKDEPSIRDVQLAAIRYAEINPARFAEWRTKVRERGLWPDTVQFTLGHDTDDDEDYMRSKTVGISGGTAYVGPDDETWGWDTDNDWDYEFRVRWDLQDYCFHNDILKVSSETEDQVELRQEILEDVTKLYFDRRRLQVEALLQPDVPIALKVKRTLQLDELTAAIDAMTGGFFSDALETADR